MSQILQSRIGNTDKLIESEQDYINSMFGLINKDFLKENRTGTDTYANYGYNLNFNIGDPTTPLPILLGKHTQLKGALVEIVWIMMGRTDNEFLTQNGVNYWTPWQRADGEFGPIYGYQMRNFNGNDQLKTLINDLRDNFESRRHMISLWNPTDLKEMVLAPCHFHYHFTTFRRNGEKFMNLHATQRSADSMVGIPYDLLMFMYMLKIVEFISDIKVAELFLTIHDYHLYENHRGPLAEYDENYHKNVQLKEILHPTQIEFKPFVLEMKKKNPNITMDEFLHFIALSNFDIFEYKNLDGSEWKQSKDVKRIKAAVAV